MSVIYAPEQDIIWFKTKKGGMETVGKFRARYIRDAGKTRYKILIMSTGEFRYVTKDSIMSISDFKGSQSDLR